MLAYRLKRFALIALAISAFLISPSGAQQTSDNPAYPGITVIEDPETGTRYAHSGKANQQQNRLGFSAASEQSILMWVVATRAANGEASVAVFGQRLRYQLPDETPQRGRVTGPFATPNPALIGSPWRKVKQTLPFVEFECVSAQHWCTRLEAIEIKLDEKLVRELLEKPTKTGIRVSVVRRTKVDWRIPYDEFVATLEAAGVLEHYR